MAVATRSRRGGGRGAAAAAAAPAPRGRSPAAGARAKAPGRGRSRSKSRSKARAEAGGEEKPKILTLPTVLTLTRVVVLGPLIAAWFRPEPWAAPLCTALFVATAFTDWLDGFLARKLDAASPFGAFLDPVADKLMVAAVLVLCCATPPPGLATEVPWLLPAVTTIVISREITMSALREAAAKFGPEAAQATAVNNLGKWKTTFQMLSLVLMLSARHVAPEGAAGAACMTGGPLLAVAAAGLTAYSLLVYFKGAWSIIF